MLTIHAGTGGTDGSGVTDGTGFAVAVEGDRVLDLGDAERLRAAHPGARLRAWPGEVRQGLGWPGVLPDAPSPRERVHALLLRGVTALGPGSLDDDPALAPAAARVGLPSGSPAPLVVGGRADFAVFAADGSCLATVLAGRLVHRRA